SGTALTVDQIKLISRYTKNIVVLFDGDEAGIKASFRGMDMILKEGLNVRIVLFPDGQDPDSFARSNSSGDVQKFITEHAVDFIRFKANLLLKETAGDPIKKASLLKDIVESIALIPDAISRSVYTAECSRILDFPEPVLIAEINKILRANFKKQHSDASTSLSDQTAGANVIPAQAGIPAFTEAEHSNEIPASAGMIDAVEREIIRILINYCPAEITIASDNTDEIEKRNVGNYIFTEISNDDLLGFENPLYGLIFDAFSNQENQVGDSYFLHHENENVKQLTIDLMNFPHNISENWAKKEIRVKKEHEEDQLSRLVSESLSAFRLCKLEKMIAERREKLKIELDEDNLQILVAELARFERARVQISGLLGRVVTK
ncbi:MAG: toprim domain-containing protein, partial [Bacteroidales bacterium]|nr:toprim domain-containing protein [Bacteroidales bacterium]